MGKKNFYGVFVSIPGQGVILILGTSLVTVITALSMSAISTNGVIKGGKPVHKVNLNIELTYHLSVLGCNLIPVEGLFCLVFLTYLFIYFLSECMRLKRVIL
jgi:hypothetical protein